ncbi:MAG: hypothetical protein K0R84_420 [Clostridia bacterium]|nr:hypothetical protein [Clostridia bacterium]
MISAIRSILSSQYFKPISQLTAGSFIAQIITVAISPISTRLYTAEQLGIYTLILTFVSMFGPVICGKYDFAIVAAEDEKEAMELTAGSMLFLIIFLLLVAAGYKIYLPMNPVIIEEIGGFAYLLIVILLLTGLINILTSYNNRHKEYKTIASVNVVRSSAQSIGLIAFGVLKLGSIGLLLSQLLGCFFGLKKQGEHLYKNRLLFRKVCLNDVKNTLIKYKNQPLFSMPAYFINSASYSILNFFISSLYGMEIFGYYSMSYRILGLPLTLISMNVSKVFFQSASTEKIESRGYDKSLRQITLLLVCFSIPMVVILIFLGPYLFELVFGEGWYISGAFVRILAPMYGIRMIVSALTPALIISEKQRLELLIQSLFLISSIGSYVICKFRGFDINSFLILITITYSIIYIFFYAAIYRLSKQMQNKTREGEEK